MFVSELGVLGYCITQVPILCLPAWSIWVGTLHQQNFADASHSNNLSLPGLSTPDPSSCLRSCVFFLHPYKATRAELLDWHSTAGLLFEEAVALVNVDRIFPGTRRLNPCQGAMPTSIPTRLSVPHPCPPAQGLLRICHC